MNIRNWIVALALLPSCGDDKGDTDDSSAAGTDDSTTINGPAEDICVGCHMGAGMDADHPGHDFVYTQVK